MITGGTPGGGAVFVPGHVTDRYDSVLLDIDGVVRRGGSPIAGAGEAVAALRARGLGVAFVTNNAASTPWRLSEELDAVGVVAAEDDIVTSAMAAADLLEPGTPCLVIGMEGLREALTARGCVVTDDPASAQVVVVGFDRGLVWDDLRRATLALHRGARFLATNDDATFPAAGEVWPGNGAVVAALERSSGRRAEIAGKPHAALLQAAARRVGGGRMLFVGDRHETDVVGAAALGWDTALVLTGITTAEQVAALTPPPTYVFASLAALVTAPTPTAVPD